MTSFAVLGNRRTPENTERPTLSSILPVVTANGFTLLAGSRIGGTTAHRFQVRASTGAQQNVSVSFGRSLSAKVDQARGTHLWVGSRFWALRAEAHLEAYLNETASCPPDGQLLIAELSDDEIFLAAYWRD